MPRNPTFHRRRNERLRRDEARRVLAQQRKQVVEDIRNEVQSALGVYLDGRGAAEAGVSGDAPAIARKH